MILYVQQWTSSRDVLEVEASVGINANWDMRGELRLQPFWVGSPYGHRIRLRTDVLLVVIAV